MKNYLLGCIFLLFSHVATAQQKFVAISMNSTVLNAAQQNYTINSKGIQDYAKIQKEGVPFQLAIDLGGHQIFEMTLTRHRVVCSNFHGITSTGERIELEDDIIYNGHLSNNTTIPVLATISNNLLYFNVLDPANEMVLTSTDKWGNNTTEITCYKVADATNAIHYECSQHSNHAPHPERINGFPDVNDLGHGVEQRDVNKVASLPKRALSATYCLDLGITVDREGLQVSGTAANFNAKMQTMLARINLYYGLFSVEYKLTPIYFVTASSNPWTNVANNSPASLDNYLAWANPNFPYAYNFTLLYTGVAQPYSYTWYGGQCKNASTPNVNSWQATHNHGIIDWAEYINISITQAGNIATHELGHGWLCDHASSTSYIMNGSIWDGILTWDNTSTAKINTRIGQVNTCFASCATAACAMSSVTAGTQTPCVSVNNNYTQSLTVQYTDAPSTGTLLVNGQSFAITSSPQTVVLTNLSANGLPVNVTASFSADAACVKTVSNLFTAPAACVTLTAYTIVVNANLASGGTTVGGGSYLSGDSATVRATANANYAFVNWTDSTGAIVSTAAVYKFRVTASRRLTANFQTDGCQGLTTYNTCNGTVTDGSLSNYANNLNCSWLIQPTAASSITLHFTSFSTESGYDSVAIYDGTTANGRFLGKYSGNTLPPDLVAPSGAMFIRFTTDTNRVASGWSANWTCASNPTYALTLSANPVQGGTVNGGGNYTSGQSVRARAVPATGWNFVNWRENGTIISSNADFTFNLTAHRTLIAYFAQNTLPSDLPADWDVVVTMENHSIAVPATVAAQIENGGLQNGDYLGVFYQNNNQWKCGGRQVWNGVATSVVAYENDLAIGKNGFWIGERFTWRIYRPATQTQYELDATYLPIGGIYTHQGNYATDGISGLASLAARVTDTLHLEQGWNMVGIYVNPADSTLTTMLAPIINQIILMKSVDGRTFIPSTGINTIQNWNIKEGYRIKMAQAADVILRGRLIDPMTFQIPFNVGWKLIPYVRTTPMLFSTVFSGNSAQIDLAKDNTGQTWIPSLNVNNIGNATVNRAYKVKFNEMGILSQPANRRGDAPLENPIAARYFEVSNKPTGEDATIILTQSSSRDVLQIGDEVGVFNAYGLLCGSVVWNGENTAIAVKGDDALTTPQEGMKIGDTYQLRIKRQGFDLPIRLNAAFENAGQAQYAADNISRLTKLTLPEMPTVPFLEKVVAFPNPIGNELTIRLESEDADAQVTLNDAMGNILQSIPEHQNVGKTQIWKFDTTHFANGAYFYTVKTVNKTHHGTYIIQH
jgi:hypothetical protein